MQTIGCALICRNSERTIESCVRSFIEHVDNCVVVFAGESTDKTVEIVEGIQKDYPDKIETHHFEWCDDFSAARNFSFSFLKNDWEMWVDSDDVIAYSENIRPLIDNAEQDVGAIWFPYEYGFDEFGNVTTLYDRERVVRSQFGWIWKGRLHETLSPMMTCRYVRADNVIYKHKHEGGESRHDRNMKLLNIMLEEDPEDKRIWLYLGHQNLACNYWLEASKWYIKFGQDQGAMAIERFQALCFCVKAMVSMEEPQAIDVALKAIELFPNYKDGYLALAQAYYSASRYQEAIHMAKLSDSKDPPIIEPPAVIFINQLDYNFNKYALLADCHTNLGDNQTAIQYLQQCYAIRPIEGVVGGLQWHQQVLFNLRIREGVKTLAVELHDNREFIKLGHLINACPASFRATPEFNEFCDGAKVYLAEIVDNPQIVEGKTGKVSVNIGNSLEPEKLLKEIDEKHDDVLVIAPFPIQGSKQIATFCQQDIENLVMSSDKRHIKNLRVEPSRIWCSYDKKVEFDLLIRMYIGQGMAPWNPKTIKEVGEGGSETSAAWVAKYFVELGHKPILYAMDNQIWDGVMYRDHKVFNAQSPPCNLFISSRIPEIFNYDPVAEQKWLWVHDIHCGSRLTPEICSDIDVIIPISWWHAKHLKRVYPFLADCEIIDFDKHPETFEDLWTGGVFDVGRPCDKLPKMAIIGDGILTERYAKYDTIKKVPNRFIWMSSADRGLEQVLDLWPMIKEGLPDAELKIYYGFEYLDKTLWIPEQREFKERLKMKLDQKGIEWCGRIGQDELALRQMEAEFLLYPPPHDFRETYGIAFLEAQAAGLVCFYRQNGALGETIGERGIPLSMDMSQQDIADKVISTSKNKEVCYNIREKGREFSFTCDWKIQAEKMLSLYRKVGK